MDFKRKGLKTQRVLHALSCDQVFLTTEALWDNIELLVESWWMQAMCPLVGDDFSQRRNTQRFTFKLSERGRTFVLEGGVMSGLVWSWCEGPEAAVARLTHRVSGRVPSLYSRQLHALSACTAPARELVEPREIAPWAPARLRPGRRVPARVRAAHARSGHLRLPVCCCGARWEPSGFQIVEGNQKRHLLGDAWKW